MARGVMKRAQDKLMSGLSVPYPVKMDRVAVAQEPEQGRVRRHLPQGLVLDSARRHKCLP